MPDTETFGPTLPPHHRTVAVLTQSADGTRMYRGGCNCGWQAPVSMSTFDGAVHSYMTHVETVANEHVDRIRAGILITEEYMLGLDA